MKRVLFGVALLGGFASAHALEPWTPTEQEMAALPTFCKVKFREKTDSPAWRQWAAGLGPDFIHVHHYCAGLNFLNRSYRSRTLQERNYNLSSARNNMQYMIDHAAPSFALMPEVYYSLGIISQLEGRTGESILNLRKAVELRPSMISSWQALADRYLAIQDRAQALQAITEGLRHNPDSQSLQRRYKELGGREPWPEPYVKREPKPAQWPDGSPAPQPHAENRPDASESPSDMRKARGPLDTVPSPVMDAPGMKPNPWCRFCPEQDHSPDPASSRPRAEPTAPR